MRLVTSNKTDHAETILGYDCNTIEYQQVNMGRYMYYVYGKYSFSPNILRVDKKFFKNIIIPTIAIMWVRRVPYISSMSPIPGEQRGIIS